MKTIEERAEEYALKHTGTINGFGTEQITNQYIEIATEQREIDIQRAVEYTCNGCCFVNRCKLKPNGYVCLNIKLLIQAMKGE